MTGWLTVPCVVLLIVAGTAVYPFGHGLSYANFSTQALTSCTGQPGSVRCHLPLLRKKTRRRQLRLASVSARQDGVAVTKCLQVGTPPSSAPLSPPFPSDHARSSLCLPACSLTGDQPWLWPVQGPGQGHAPRLPHTTQCRQWWHAAAVAGGVRGRGAGARRVRHRAGVSLGDDDFTLAGDGGQWRAVPGTWKLEVGGAEFDVEV